MKVVIITGFDTFLGKSIFKNLQKSSDVNTFHCISPNPIEKNDDLHKNTYLHTLDLNNFSQLHNLINNIENYDIIEVYHCEIYRYYQNENFINMMKTKIIATLNLLDIFKSLNLEKNSKFIFPIGSDIFGEVQEIPQSEISNFCPKTINGIINLNLYWLARFYRESYGFYIHNTILFNIQGIEINKGKKTRKILDGLNKILKNKNHILKIDNISVYRDFIHIDDVLSAVSLLLKCNKSEDVIISSFSAHNLKEFIEKSFAIKGINIKWRQNEGNSIGYEDKSGKHLILVNKKTLTFCKTCKLLGDNTKLCNLINWKPKMTFDNIIHDMVNNLVTEKKKKGFFKWIFF